MLVSYDMVYPKLCLQNMPINKLACNLRKKYNTMIPIHAHLIETDNFIPVSIIVVIPININRSESYYYLLIYVLSSF